MARIEISNPVWIRLKKDPTDRARLGENVDEEVLYGKRKIGSGFRGRNPLKGVTIKEEHKYLPPILGLTPKSENWNKASNTYWADFGVTVPIDNIGLELEAGMWYENQEAADKAIAEETSEAKKVKLARENGRHYVEKHDVRSELGTPLDISDYLLWRYCLVYSGCANVPEDVDKSPKIQFYLFSKARDIQVKSVGLESRKKSLTKYLEIISQPSIKNALLYLFKIDVERYNKENPTKKLEVNTLVGKDIALETIAMTYPDRFLAVTMDSLMLERAFIERAIDANELRRLPNTDIIYYGDNTKIGNNTLEAVNFLKEARNSEVFQTIKARIALKEDESGNVMIDHTTTVANEGTSDDNITKFQQPITETVVDLDEAPAGVENVIVDDNTKISDVD